MAKPTVDNHFASGMVVDMATLTLKSFPASLHEALKRRARRNHRSLNSEAIACIEQIVAPTAEHGTAILEQIRASRSRLAAAGLPPMTDDFLDAARREGRR
jgi:plasmid stability protein